MCGCSLALVIHHEKFMCRIIFLSVARLVVPYFPHYLINGKIFRKIFLNIKCMFYFIYKFLSFWQEFRKMLSQMYIGPHVKYLLFLSYFNQTSIFLDKFLKYPQTSNFIKICFVGAKLFHAKRWRERQETDSWMDRHDAVKSLFAILGTCLIFITFCVLRIFNWNMPKWIDILKP